MKREIFETAQATALFEDGVLMEYLPAKKEESAGGIYLGRVERYVPGMQAVFVDIGLTKNAFLPLESKTPMQSGASLLVQVKKEPMGDKGAFLTQNISLPGTFSVFLPIGESVGVSAKIQDADLREMLKQIQLPYGSAIIRTAAQYTSLEDVQNELDELVCAYESIQAMAKVHNPPMSLWGAVDSAAKLKRDYEGRFEQAQSGYNLEKQLEEALKRRVWLKSGGFIVIDLCEAMTVIDVNTGKFTGKKHFGETILKTNLEACEKIVQQVRLRNLSGIILIDFIDMETEEARQAVFQKLTETFLLDRKGTTLEGFTKLGLMEMTRKRDSLPLAALMKE
jgi:Ribonucleases G and E